MKLVMDFVGAMSLRAGMDDNRLDLIIRLCTMIGMIMEDTSELALTVRGVGTPHLNGRLDEIDKAVRQMHTLIATATSLADPAGHAG